MARKLGMLAVVALAAAAVAGWTMSASASKPAAAQPQGVTYLDHTVKGTYVDNARSGFSAGDEFVFHDVFKQGGQKKGTIDGVCKITMLLGKNGAFDVCTAGLKLSDGQITFEVGGKNIGTSKKAFNVSITGGTGAYRTARGYARIKPISENNSRFTIYVSK